MNDAASNFKLNPVTFTVLNEELFSSKNISLQESIKELFQKEINNQGEIVIKDDDYHNLNAENQKMYKIVSIKVKINKQECIGLYIKDVTKTSNKILNATTENVSNTLICTFSHEIRTPINQALGIVTKLKESIKDKAQKLKIGLVKSAILKLFLTVEEYLYYGKIISNNFAVNLNKATLSEISKEIKRMNYEYFFEQLNKKIAINIELKYKKVKLFIDIRLVLMILQFIIEKLINQKNVNYIEIIAILYEYNRRLEFIIIGKGQSSFFSSSNMLDTASFRVTYNDLYKESTSVQNVSEFRKIYIDKICSILDTKIESSITETNCEKYSVTFDSFQNNRDSVILSESEYREFENFKEIQSKNNNINRSLIINARKKCNHITKHSAMDLKKIKPIVYVVEDQIMNRYAVCGMLKSFDVQIVEAEDGIECLQKYNKLSPIEKEHLLILMDLSMPNMYGITCCYKIRELEKDFGSPIVPIIALTAHDSEIEKRKALKAGMNEFCTKPLRKDKLIELLDKYLFSKV